MPIYLSDLPPWFLERVSVSLLADVVQHISNPRRHLKVMLSKRYVVIYGDNLLGFDDIERARRMDKNLGPRFPVNLAYDTASDCDFDLYE